MANKIIINIEDGISDSLALSCVRSVVACGRISKSGDRAIYCYVTYLITEEGEICITTHPRRKNDVFTVEKRK